MEYDDNDSPEQIWRSNKENDLGYICERCGHTPSFRELKDGTCGYCRGRHRSDD